MLLRASSYQTHRGLHWPFQHRAHAATWTDLTAHEKFHQYIGAEEPFRSDGNEQILYISI